MNAVVVEQEDGLSRARRSFRRRIDVVAPSSIPSRGARFLKRVAPLDNLTRTATLADLVTLPDWIMLDEVYVDDVASIAALLHFRRQIDKIVDGDQIRQICEILGEDNFDRACDAALPSEDTLASVDEPLPPTNQLRDFGKRLLERALPSIMSDRFEGARGDLHLSRLVNHAVAMVKQSHQDERL